MPYAPVGIPGYSRRGTPGRPPTGSVEGVRLNRPARRALLVVHVVASAGWLGLSLGLLALGVTAATTASPGALEAGVRAMQLFADRLLLPLALLTLLSGVVLALGTPWGLARHRWVFTKFWLTLATTAATAFVLRPAVDSAAEAVAAGGPPPRHGGRAVRPGRLAVLLRLHDGDLPAQAVGPHPARAPAAHHGRDPRVRSAARPFVAWGP